ncbi:hypothetical protein C2U30_17270 [Aeromonas sp. ASNIH5]|nr:hypothetical protein C2U30_17270 [Aeromonas sp. ASNIH5]
MGGAYLRSRIKQAGKWDQETIVSFFLCQYCSGEYLLLSDLPDVDKVDKRAKEAIKQIEDNVGSLYCAETGELSLDKLNDLNKKAFGRD